MTLFPPQQRRMLCPTYSGQTRRGQAQSTRRCQGLQRGSMKILSMGPHLPSLLVMFLVWAQIQDLWSEESEMYGSQLMLQKLVCDGCDLSTNVIRCSTLCYSYIKKPNVPLLAVGSSPLLSALYHHAIALLSFPQESIKCF